jgi:hypothetical protein
LFSFVGCHTPSTLLSKGGPGRGGLTRPWLEG